MKSHTPLLLALCLVLPACVTLTTSSKQQVSFTSDPSGAVVIVDGEVRGVTPTSLRLDRKGRRGIVFEFADHDRLEAELGSHYNPWAALGVMANLILPPLNVPGMVIDGLSGRGLKFDADSVHADLATGIISLGNN